jgi:predicted ribosomally synthesized peptide with SipW-like signal peptide
MKNRRRGLYLLLAAGLLGLGAGGGTFASFNAATTNPGNTFSTGSLLLQNTGPNSVVCNSSSGANNSISSGCDFFSAGGSTNAPGSGSFTTETFTLKNTGTINASTFNLAVSSCSSSQTQTFTFNTGNLCNDTVTFIQETNDSMTGASNNYCWYGLTAAPSTYAPSAGTSGACDQTTSDLNASNKTLSTLGGGGATFGALSSNAPVAGADLPAGTTRTFEVGLYLPSSVGNTDQDLKASMDLTWTANQ